MAKRPRKPRENLYEAYKEASGWYLAAWRDKKGLTIEELAEAMGTGKSTVSDLETGALNKSGAMAQRLNKDWIRKAKQALGVSEGFLFQVNPFEAQQSEFLEAEVSDLTSEEQVKLAAFIQGLKAAR